MNKEECNNFAIPLPAWVSQFVPHFFLTPQHNLVKEGQKDQLILNVTKRPTMEAIPINLMISTNQGTEMDCTFGSVLTTLLTHIWNLCITFPDHNISMHAKDVKSCLR